MVSGWSLAAQFDDFGRGVLSLSSTVYFVLVAVVGLYLSMVLIGSRHWSGGQRRHVDAGPLSGPDPGPDRDGLGVNFIFTNQQPLEQRPPRPDRRQGRARCPRTPRRLLRELKAEHPINIEAFVSGQVPEVYAKTKADLLSLLKEFRRQRRAATSTSRSTPG